MSVISRRAGFIPSIPGQHSSYRSDPIRSDRPSLIIHWFLAGFVAYLVFSESVRAFTREFIRMVGKL